MTSGGGHEVYGGRSWLCIWCGFVRWNVMTGAQIFGVGLHRGLKPSTGEMKMKRYAEGLMCFGG